MSYGIIFVEEGSLDPYDIARIEQLGNMVIKVRPGAPAPVSVVLDHDEDTSDI